MSLCVHCQHYDRHRKGSDDTDECDEEHSRVWRSANTSPVPPFMSSPSTNGSSEDDEGVADPVDTPELAVTSTHATDNEVKAKRLPLPSAELTYDALDPALQLPGTEWISNFWSFRELVRDVPRSDHNQTQGIEKWKVMKTVLIYVVTVYDGFSL